MKRELVKVEDLSISFDGKPVFNDVSLTLYEDEVTVLLGPNGSGKTTLIGCIQGLLTPTNGSISILGQNPRRQSEWKDKFGAMLQESQLDSDLTVFETVDRFSSYYSNPLGVEEVLTIVGLSDQAGKKTFKLSGGQKKRLDFALSLVGNPMFLTLDEPTASLDQQSKRQMWYSIREVKNTGTGILLTTHDIQEINALFDRIIILNQGSIVLNEPSETIRSWMDKMLVKDAGRTDSYPEHAKLIKASALPSSEDSGAYHHPDLVDFYEYILEGGNIEL